MLVKRNVNLVCLVVALVAASACDSSDDGGDAVDASPVQIDALQAASVCVESDLVDWSRTGNDICADLGLYCAGVAYHENSIDCTDGDPHVECWSSTPTACCQYPMSDHAGMGAGRSALWSCQDTCPSGSELDQGLCVDIDECARGIDDCGADASCINQIGAFRCVCDIGFTGDGYTCTPAGNDPACITSSDAAWLISGDEYCSSHGLTCGGVSYFDADAACGGASYDECWGSNPAECCGYAMTDHAGTPAGTSALWTCN